MGDGRSGRRDVFWAAVLRGLTFALGAFVAVPLNTYLHGYSWQGWWLLAVVVGAFGFHVGVVATLLWAAVRRGIEMATDGEAESA